METNDLMKSLERMKSVLADVLSAKQQVETTVNAYTNLCKEMSCAVGALNNISSGLSDVIENLQNDYITKVNQFKKDEERIILSSNQAINKLDNSVKKFEELINQKIQEQEQYFIDNAKQQKWIMFALLGNLILSLLLMYQIFMT